MQVSCFGVDWKLVEPFDDAQSLYDGIFEPEALEDHEIAPPDGLWTSDSAMQHFEAADELEAAAAASADPAFAPVCALISTGQSVDELGLCDVSEGCLFVSLSPPSVERLRTEFKALADSEPGRALSEGTRAWLDQWLAAFEYFSSRGLGVIGHCG